MIRGPDGIRQHVLFVPGRNTNDREAIIETLDEIEAWIEATFDPNAYIYRRYSVTSSIFFHNLRDVIAVKLRWDELMMME